MAEICIEERMGYSHGLSSYSWAERGRLWGEC